MTQPGAGRPIDVAFVEIVPDTDQFVARLRRQTREAFDDLEQVAERAGERVEDDLSDAADNVGKAFDRSADQIGESMQEAATTVEKAFDRVDTSSIRLHRDIDKRVKDTGSAFDKGGEQIANALEQAFEKANAGTSRLDKTLGTLGESLVSIGSAIVGLGASAPTPAGLIAIAAVLTAIASLAPLILSLVAALADLAGLVTLLPAGLSVLLAAVAPLVIAFQGFGEAIEAIISKDPKKIKEALDALAPSARRVAKEFQALLPAFERLGDVVQEALFSRLQGSLTNVANALLPALTVGLSNVASALGDLGAAFAGVLASAGTQSAIAAIFATTETVIRTLTPAVTRLFEVLISAVQAGLPFVERLASALGDALGRFAEFLATSIETGQFQAFFEDAVKTVGELLDLGRALGGLFLAIFGDLDDAGRGFIGTLTDLVDRMTAFFESAEGQDLIQDLIERIPQVAKVLGFLVNVLIEFLDFIADINDATEATGKFFSDLGDEIVKLFGKIGDFISGVGDFFATLPDRILAAVQAIPGLLLDFFTFLFDQLFTAIGRGIGLLIFAFTELPGLLLVALVALPGVLRDLFVNTFNDVTTFVVGALENLIRIIPDLLGQAVEIGRQVVINGFNAIIEFIKSVPGRIRDAFLAAGSLVVEIGAAIGNALKSVINRAIDRINDGIGQIDDALPGTLPRIPRLQGGGVVTEELLARMGEGGRAEGVIPLENPSALRMIGQAIADAGGLGGAGLFGPGSIVVQFAGVIPTPAQAQQVGRDVGAGMAEALERRDARLRVRTI